MRSLLTDPGFTDNKLWIVTPTPGNYRLLGPYGERATPARWAVLTDGLLPTNQFRTNINNLDDRRDGDWRIRTDDVSGQVVIDRKDGRSIATLTQDTLKNSAYTSEVDLWLMAIAPVPGLIYQPGLVDFSRQPTLADMTHMTFSWSEQLLARQAKQRVGGWGDCALTMCSVYFENQITRQVFQYEVMTSDNRAFFPEGGWFANLPDGQFVGAVDNSATIYRAPYLEVRDRMRNVSFDILPRVRHLLASCPNIHLDKDESHWKVLMATWGTFTNGAARIETRFSNLNLEYEV